MNPPELPNDMLRPMTASAQRSLDAYISTPTAILKQQRYFATNCQVYINLVLKFPSNTPPLAACVAFEKKWKSIRNKCIFDFTSRPSPLHRVEEAIPSWTQHTHTGITRVLRKVTQEAPHRTAYPSHWFLSHSNHISSEWTKLAADILVLGQYSIVLFIQLHHNYIHYIRTFSIEPKIKETVILHVR